MIRHFTHLSRENYSVDLGFYPLGSCTMKYNPKINEEAARLPGFGRLHPYLPDSAVQGALEVLYEMQHILTEIAGMDATQLQPAAGAHGELLGLMLIKAYHADRGRSPPRHDPGPRSRPRHQPGLGGPLRLQDADRQVRRARPRRTWRT